MNNERILKIVGIVLTLCSILFSSAIFAKERGTKEEPVEIATELQPGEKISVGITYEMSQSVSDIIAYKGRKVVKDIAGKIVCDRKNDCVVSIAAARNAENGDYKLHLLDNRKQILVNYAVHVFEKAIKPDDTQPEIKLNLQPGGTVSEALSEKIAQDVFQIVALIEGKAIKDLVGEINCPKSKGCTLSITASQKIREGEYKLHLYNKSEELLAKYLVAVFYSDYESDESQSISADPDLSIQRSCQDEVLSDETMAVNLISPNADAGLTVGTQLEWSRADAEVCPYGGSDRRYNLSICSNSNPSIQCQPNDSSISIVRIDDQYLGNGVCEIVAGETPEDNGTCRIGFSTLQTRIPGLTEGDPVYWQMRYRADSFSNIYGPVTEKRRLYYGVADDEPEPEPEQQCDDCPVVPILHSPADGSRLHSTNKYFYWSDDEDADPSGNSFFWEVCFMQGEQDNCLANGPLKATDNSLTGFDLYELKKRGLAGSQIRWKVRACKVASDSNICSYYSNTRIAFVPTPPAERTYPADRAVVTLPRTLIWREVEGADYYNLTLTNLTTNLSYRSEAIETTSANITQTYFPQTLETNADYSWDVQSCWDRLTDGVYTAVCSDMFYGVTGDDVGPSFLKLIDTGTVSGGNVSFWNFKDVFKAESCLRCHDVDIGDQTIRFPVGHPDLGAGVDTHNSSNCMGCHGSKIEQYEQIILDGMTPQQAQEHNAVEWHAPHQMNLRGLSDSALYNAALADIDSANNVYEHLTQDALILWALDGGERPNGQLTEKAFAGTLEEWKQLIFHWFNDADSRYLDDPMFCARGENAEVCNAD